MIVTEREREAETQAEGEAGSMHREPDVGFDPGSPGSRPGPKAGAKPLRHPGIPPIYFYFYLYFFFFLRSSIFMPISSQSSHTVIVVQSEWSSGLFFSGYRQASLLSLIGHVRSL